MYFAFAASLIWETLVEENREQIVSSIPLVECSRGSSDFLLSVSSWNDFSKDTGLSSLVSIEPNTDCSQWLSSVSDMKERAQARLTAPKQRFQSKKDVQEEKKAAHLYCKTKKNAVKIIACPDTLQRNSFFSLIYLEAKDRMQKIKVM